MTSRQKPIVLFAAIIVVCVAILSGHAQDFWQQTGGPYGGDIYCLAINSVGHIFAGTNGNGIYRSSDNGNSWIQVNTGLTNKTVYALAINSSDHLFAGTDAGVFRSIDNGDHWEQKGLSGKVFSIAINPAGHLYASSYSGIFRSTTNGDSWSLKYRGPYEPFEVRTITINSSWHIFFGLWNYVFRSTDNGDNWRKLNTTWQGTVYVLFNIPMGTIFTGTGSGIFRSSNNGDNWIEVSTGLVNKDVRSFAFESGGQIFAGTYGGGVYRSDNNGDTWTSINTGLTNPFVLALAISSSGHLFAGTWGNGVFRSIQPITSVAENEGVFPQSHVLWQNYPNPFNPETMIQYQLPKQAEVRLEIYNVLGELVRTLVNEKQPPRYYTVRWNGKDEHGRPVASGVYLYSLRAGEFVQVRKMMLIR